MPSELGDEVKSLRDERPGQWVQVKQRHLDRRTVARVQRDGWDRLVDEARSVPTGGRCSARATRVSLCST